MNEVMPFIRYSPGDRAIPNNNVNFYKALPYSVNDFIGRSTDMISTKDGRKLAGVNFFTMMYKIEGVEMFQIIQSGSNNFVIKIIPSSLFTQDTIEEIRKGFVDRVGECNVEVCSVLNLDRTESGKFKTIINEYQFS
jgi:phenylacetate-coenzyme A ligase PaaK-like adenylate-forming protein